MACSTIFSGFNQPVEDKALLIIIKDIKEGKYKADIENIRALILSGDTDKADKLKKQFPAFTPSGTFKGGRKVELLDQYSGFVHLDFDKLSEVQINTAFQIIAGIRFTFAYFRSPSGNGLKVFVEVNSVAESHDTAYRQVQLYYEKILGISSDPKCKDITRLSFVSDDLETYKNVHNQIFEVTISETESQTKIQEKEARAYQKSFEDCIQFTEQKENYQTGNRNNFVYLLACNCNRSGIPENEALDLIMTNFDLSEVEIKASVRSAYSHHFNEFANFAKSAKSGKKESIQAPSTETVSEDYLKNTPVIPLEVYNELPDLIKSGAIPITDWREGCLSHRGIGDS